MGASLRRQTGPLGGRASQCLLADRLPGAGLLLPLFLGNVRLVGLVAVVLMRARVLPAKILGVREPEVMPAGRLAALVVLAHFLTLGELLGLLGRHKPVVRQLLVIRSEERRVGKE